MRLYILIYVPFFIVGCSNSSQEKKTESAESQMVKSIIKEWNQAKPGEIKSIDSLQVIRIDSLTEKDKAESILKWATIICDMYGSDRYSFRTTDEIKAREDSFEVYSRKKVCIQTMINTADDKAVNGYAVRAVTYYLSKSLVPEIDTMVFPITRNYKRDDFDIRIWNKCK